MMDLNARIYVAGTAVLAGSALARRLKAGGYRDIVTRTHAELDLTDTAAVSTSSHPRNRVRVPSPPQKSARILANRDHRRNFISRTSAIQTNVIHEAWRQPRQAPGFPRSSCIYPRDCRSR